VNEREERNKKGKAEYERDTTRNLTFNGVKNRI